MIPLLQSDSISNISQAVQEVVEPVTTKTEISLFDIVFSGGPFGQAITVVLFIMLFFSFYIYLEGFFALRNSSKIDENFMDQIKKLIMQGKVVEAKDLCRNSNSILSRIIQKGIERIGKPIDDIDLALENAGKLEIYELEKKTNTLATLSGAGPMTGFLGTVVGMVIAFHEIASSSTGKIDMSILAEGIYTAMITTVIGLIVGITAYVGYNHLVGKINLISNKLESCAIEFIDLLIEPV